MFVQAQILVCTYTFIGGGRYVCKYFYIIHYLFHPEAYSLCLKEWFIGKGYAVQCM